VLAAGKFVREAVERGDPLRQLAATRDPVIDDRLADDVADSETRVERGVGVLKDDLELAPIGPPLMVRQAVDALALDADLARGGIDR